MCCVSLGIACVFLPIFFPLACVLLSWVSCLVGVPLCNLRVFMVFAPACFLLVVISRCSHFCAVLACRAPNWDHSQLWRRFDNAELVCEASGGAGASGALSRCLSCRSCCLSSSLFLYGIQLLSLVTFSYGHELLAFVTFLYGFVLLGLDNLNSVQFEGLGFVLILESVRVGPVQQRLHDRGALLLHPCMFCIFLSWFVYFPLSVSVLCLVSYARFLLQDS